VSGPIAPSSSSLPSDVSGVTTAAIAPLSMA
jgi:hypothetical protein